MVWKTLVKLGRAGASGPGRVVLGAGGGGRGTCRAACTLRGSVCRARGPERANARPTTAPSILPRSSPGTVASEVLSSLQRLSVSRRSGAARHRDAGPRVAWTGTVTSTWPPNPPRPPATGTRRAPACRRTSAASWRRWRRPRCSAACLQVRRPLPLASACQRASRFASCMQYLRCVNL